MSTVAGAPDSTAPVVAGPEAAAAVLQEGREYSSQRQTIIAANPELQERELIKLASLAAAIADTLRQRGVSDPAASLTAEAGIAVFGIAVERWNNETNQQDFTRLIRESLDEMKAVTAGHDHGATSRAKVVPAAGPSAHQARRAAKARHRSARPQHRSARRRL